MFETPAEIHFAHAQFGGLQRFVIVFILVNLQFVALFHHLQT